ncbi:MAG: hypothetical protein ACRD19_01455 [Terriglobia bacterium]
MLPDFPSVKSEIQNIILAKLSQLVRYGDPAFSGVKRFVQHEGQQMRYEQLGGTTVQEGFEEIGTHFEVLIGDVPTLVGEKLDAKLNEIAQELISRSAKVFFRKMEDSCQKAGTAMDAGGNPISPEMLLQMWSAVQLEFRPDGKPAQTFVIHPDMFPAVKKAMEQIENDPELKRRHNAIIDRQRQAWAARESNRKLVD